MHTFKRFYLTGILLFSIAVPFITISYTAENTINSEYYLYQSLKQETIGPSEFWNFQSLLNPLLIIIYGIGTFLFLIRLIFNLKSLKKEIAENTLLNKVDFILVLIKKQISPYSFLNYIFLNKAEYEKDKISKAIIEHEKAHVDQKHSLDILLIEFLQIIFWFNPVLYWLKKSMKLNHEFLADRAVLSKNIDAHQYFNILYNYSSGHYPNSLSSPMSQSLIKKRILMISKSFSFKSLITRLGLLVPVLCLCLYLFNNEIVAKPALVNENSPVILQPLNQDSNLISVKIDEDNLFINGKSVKVSRLKAYVDELYQNKSDEEVKNVGIRMKMINPDQDFIKKVNAEFRKTRLARLNGLSILPPPPPAPPKPGKAVVASEAPKHDKEKYMEIETIEKVGGKDVVTKQITIKSGDNPPPPPPPNPMEEIDKINKAGGSFFYNGSKISAEKTKELVKSKKDLNIKILKLDDGTQKVELFDN
ncbi:M56 family metallopeptidase [Christiangramia aquimixticola]|uniref:M56 family metallopeptidase n=1 Tax=Christiangramia aquimixticola TaxID=1697558 RepID=UPI003AA812A8